MNTIQRRDEQRRGRRATRREPTDLQAADIQGRQESRAGCTHNWDWDSRPCGTGAQELHTTAGKHSSNQNLAGDNTIATNCNYNTHNSHNATIRLAKSRSRELASCDSKKVEAPIRGRSAGAETQLRGQPQFSCGSRPGCNPVIPGTPSKV
jgi:hypothetical protein